MTSPLNYSVSSFFISNEDDTENDIEEDDNLFGNHDDNGSDISFPTFDELPDLDSEFEVDDSFSLGSTQESNITENSINSDSDHQIDEHSIEQESQRTKSESETRQSVESENVDISQKCPICLSAWSNVGSHRLCSLRCGHLFGYKCIEQWLTSTHKSAKKCPQCNTRASKKHIRCIYANKLVSVDNSELENFKKQLSENKLQIFKMSRALRKEKQKAKKYKKLFKRLKK